MLVRSANNKQLRHCSLLNGQNSSTPVDVFVVKASGL